MGKVKNLKINRRKKTLLKENRIFNFCLFLMNFFLFILPLVLLIFAPLSPRGNLSDFFHKLVWLRDGHWISCSIDLSLLHDEIDLFFVC